jgi:hypothetical protein
MAHDHMAHHHRVEPRNGPSGPATVMLDIGEGRGAAIVYAPRPLDGAEVELRRTDRPWDGTHTEIRRRDIGPDVVFAGVFGSLPAGRYQVRLRGAADGPPPVTDLSVTGGGIVEVHWS